MSHFASEFMGHAYLVPADLYREYATDLVCIDGIDKIYEFQNKYLNYELRFGDCVDVKTKPLSFSLVPKAIEIEGFENITISDGTIYTQEDPLNREDIFYYLTKGNFELTKVQITKDNERTEINLSRESLRNLIKIFQTIEKLME